VPTVLSHDVFFYVGGFVMLAVALKICSVLAPEIGKDFSRIAKSAEETFLTFYSHEE
jgi:hypothetical protein